jgi:hypothetical protein
MQLSWYSPPQSGRPPPLSYFLPCYSIKTFLIFCAEKDFCEQPSTSLPPLSGSVLGFALLSWYGVGLNTCKDQQHERIKMKKLLTSLALFSAFSANAEFLSGDDLYYGLTSSNAQVKGQSQGYILGVFDTLVNKTVCAPKEATSNVIVLVALKQLEDGKALNKEYSGSTIVRYALENKYPCKKVTL